ncbi:Uncharacterised protein [Mycobacterium tuberculosis]|nr:Uncharacterised protein [Mycobacterium tuberculosis]
MTQLLLAIAIMLAGVALGVTEVVWGRRRRAEIDARFTELAGQVGDVQGSLDEKVTEVRGDVALARTEMRDLHAAELRRAAAALHDEVEQSRRETVRQVAEVVDALDTLREDLKTDVAESRRQALARIERVTEELRSLAQHVGQNDQRAQSGLAEAEKRLGEVERKQQNHARQLTALKAEPRGAVRGKIECGEADTDIGYAVEDVLFRLAGAAGLRLVSNRVLRSTPLTAHYWFSGVDEAELADWLAEGARAEDPRVKALFEIAKTMKGGTVSLGELSLGGGSGRYRIGGQHADLPA